MRVTYSQRVMVLGLQALLICLMVGGCGKRSPDRRGSIDYQVDKSYERGPLAVHVRLEKSELSLAETATLELEAAVEPAYEVRFPTVNEILRDFGIVDWQRPESRLDDAGRIVQTYRYRLEPFVSGEYAVPAFTFRFHDVNEPDKTYELATEPIDLKVTSLLDPQRDELVIADIEGPVEIAKPPSYAWVWLLGAVTLMVAAAILILRRRKKVAALVRIFKPAHEVAYARLRRLVAEKLVESGRIKGFYERISGILRHYIEDRFDLRAPERTTEEFLAELGSADVLAPSHKACLEEFLTHCDLVKFARHQPTAEQIQRTFDVVRQFIEQTQSSDRRIDVTDHIDAGPGRQAEVA